MNKKKRIRAGNLLKPPGGRKHAGFVSLTLLLIVLLQLAAPIRSAARQDSSQEDKFKAAYIYNFLQFIEWPDSAFRSKSSPIVIGILNRDAFVKTLEQIVGGERIHGRTLVVRKCRDAKELKECQVFYVPKSEEANLQAILSSTNGLNVLTVGEVEGFAQQGGAINFFVQDNKLRFEINPDVLKQAGLIASSRLLRLAKIVRTDGGG